LQLLLLLGVYMQSNVIFGTVIFITESIGSVEICDHVMICDAEFTGDLRLALDARPVSPSSALSDSLDITAEIAEPTPAAVAPLEHHPSSTVDMPPVAASTSSDQLLARLRLDLSKSSAAGGPRLLRFTVRNLRTSIYSGLSLFDSFMIY